eukprot:scpid68858/ scgid34740/ Caspase-8; Caspase-8 subunit p18; Caspase-8 subunit p10
MAEAVADRVYQDANSDDKISRAVERVKFAQQVLQLADSLDKKESLAKEVKTAVDHAGKGVDVSSFSKNADLLYRLAQDGLRHNNDNHVRVGDCLERLTNETYSYESRGDALDHLYRTSAGVAGKHNEAFPMMTRDQKRRGHAIIINTETFLDPMADRLGSQADVSRIQKLAEWLQFDVSCQKDAQGDLLDVFKSILKGLEADYQKSDWLMCFFMSLGVQGHLLSSNGNLVSIQDLYGAAQDPLICKSLALSELPKLFFIQGSRTHTPELFTVVSHRAKPPVQMRGQNSENTLLAYATQEGREALRFQSRRGSPYLYILDQVVRELAPRRKHLVEILTEVTRRCQTKDIPVDTEDGVVSTVSQTPSTEAAVSKHIYLNWSED